MARTKYPLVLSYLSWAGSGWRAGLWSEPTSLLIATLTPDTEQSVTQAEFC